MKDWNKLAKEILLNKKIVEVRYMNEEETGGDLSTVVLHLNDGTLIYATSDEEGNDLGVLNYQKDNGECGLLPRLDS